MGSSHRIRPSRRMRQQTAFDYATKSDADRWIGKEHYGLARDYPGGRRRNFRVSSAWTDPKPPPLSCRICCSAKGEISTGPNCMEQILFHGFCLLYGFTHRGLRVVSTAKEYRAYAAECMDSARDAGSDVERDNYLQMAADWLQAATMAEMPIPHANKQGSLHVGRRSQCSPR